MRSFIKLNNNLTLYFDKYFPYLNKDGSSKRHFVTLGIGGNIGNVRKRFFKLFIHLKRDNLVHIVETTAILKNPAFGYINQCDFYNCIITIKTNLNPQKLLQHILKIEKKFQRKRKFNNSPRTLDIDIIFFDKLSIDKKNLTIPHPEFKNRSSVLIPLSLLKKRH